MKWAWRIARIAGIDIRLHITFLALLAWIAWSSYVATGTLAGVLDGVLLICLVFAIIVAHELGHALTARRFGVKTRDITLLPIGGVASLERMPDNPRQELLVALAGPAVNFVLAAVLALICLPLGYDLLPQPSSDAQVVDAQIMAVPLLVRLVWINLTLGLFNLLPAFPMDGGRALRALLALRLSDIRATRIAAGLGQAMAIVFGVVGLFVSPVLVFIALFLWIGASGEARVAEVKAVAYEVPVSAAMVREFEAVSPDLSMSAPLRRLLETGQHDFPVVSGGRVIGMLSRESMLQTLAAHGPEISIGEVMRLVPTLLHPSDNLDDALMKVMQTGEAIPVVDAHERLVGMLTNDSLADFLLIRQALEQRTRVVGQLPAARMLGS